jgi:hypothetical protein
LAVEEEAEPLTRVAIQQVEVEELIAVEMVERELQVESALLVLMVWVVEEAEVHIQGLIKMGVLVVMAQ